IYFFSVISDVTNKDELKLTIEEESTVKEVVDKIIQYFGKKFRELILKNPNEINDYIIIAKNGKDVRSLNNLNTFLQDGDEISFLPAIAGG
ncbi:MAG: MoaD/ThiS family protein, partial [Candidatus Hermodarchaeota archaeon]